MAGETEQSVSAFTVDSLKVLHEQSFADVQRQIADLRLLLNERYETQTKALDAAFRAAEKSNAAALESAEKAVAKAEAASDKRFESVNEFRAQLADQAATFMVRAEADARFSAMSEKLDAAIERAGAALNSVEQRLNTSAGEEAGSRLTKANIYAALGLAVTIMTVVISAVVLYANSK